MSWFVINTFNRLIRKTIAADSQSNSVHDILLTQLQPRLPLSGTISTLDTGDIPSTGPATTSVTTAGRIVQDGSTGAPTVATLTASASANTFGAWVQIDASAAADVWISHLTVQINNNNTATASAVVEIGTGGAGAEGAKARFSFYYPSLANNGQAPIVFVLPIPIKVASGTRIAARVATGQAVAIQALVGISYYVGLEA